MQITEFSVCVLKKNRLVSFTVILGERLNGVHQTLPREGKGGTFPIVNMICPERSFLLCLLGSFKTNPTLLPRQN